MKNDLTTYLDLCTQYYDLDKPIAPANALNFYMHYVQKAQGPILEPMCGTGRFLIPILEAGFEIDGFDASPHMLKALEAQCAAKKLKPNAWQQFLQDINIKKQYALIFIPSGSFSLIIDMIHIKLSLQKIFEHLLPGGLFVFEVETPQSVSSQLGIWHGSMQTRHDGSIIIASSLSFAPVDNIGTSIGRYDLIDKGNLLKTEFEHYQLRLYTINTMLPLLQEVGFKTIRPLKSYDLDALPATNDESIVFECIK